MSEGVGLPLAVALELAKRLTDELAPVVRRSKVAGSCRRRLPRVHDIEIVAEPQMHGDLFGGETPLIEPIQAVCRRWGAVTKAGDRYIQIVREIDYHVDHGACLKIDLFLVHPPAQWGPILAIRTGPAELGHLAVTRMRERGFRCVDGHIERIATGERVPCETEKEFFGYAGLPCLSPSRRDTPAARTPLEAMP